MDVHIIHIWPRQYDSKSAMHICCKQCEMLQCHPLLGTCMISHTQQLCLQETTALRQLPSCAWHDSQTTLCIVNGYTWNMPHDPLGIPIPDCDHKTTQHAVYAIASPDSVHLVQRGGSRPPILVLFPTPFFARLLRQLVRMLVGHRIISNL